jgi:hypothetical protein
MKICESVETPKKLKLNRETLRVLTGLRAGPVAPWTTITPMRIDSAELP